MTACLAWMSDAVLAAGLICHGLLRGCIGLWLCFEVVDDASPDALDGGYVSLTSLQVLVHVVHHSLCPLQNLTLAFQFLGNAEHMCLAKRDIFCELSEALTFIIPPF